MNEDQDDFECSFCENTVAHDDDFCPDCGTLFSNEIDCVLDPGVDATGVCVICCEPYCENCGSFVENKVFLCIEHAGYEIIENYAKVLGSNDETEIEYAKSILEAEELHPIIYTKEKYRHIAVPTEYLIQTSGTSSGDRVNQIKLMVPFQEVLKAAEILKGIDLS